MLTSSPTCPVFYYLNKSMLDLSFLLSLSHSVTHSISPIAFRASQNSYLVFDEPSSAHLMFSITIRKPTSPKMIVLPYRTRRMSGSEFRPAHE